MGDWYSHFRAAIEAQQQPVVDDGPTVAQRMGARIVEARDRRTDIQDYLNEMQSANETRRRAIESEIADEIDANLVETVREAEAGAREARGDLDRARTALEAHRAGLPQRGDVSGWSRRTAELEHELHAYEQLHQQAAGRYQQAHQRYRAAIAAGWRRRLADAEQELQRIQEEEGQRVQQAAAALMRVQEEARRKIEEAGDRLNRLRAAAGQ